LRYDVELLYRPDGFVKQRGGISMQTKPSVREKVLAAAEEVAREVGASRLTLEAVAERAGVSKGGLLYHFPSKSKLMQGMVSAFLQTVETALDARRAEGTGTLLAYLDQMATGRCSDPPPSGILAAMAEDPQMMEPIHRFEARVLNAVRAEAKDPDTAISIYMAVQGIRCMDLLGLQILGDEDVGRLISHLKDAAARTS
jgi:AcrR family transcriptional regulator